MIDERWHYWHLEQQRRNNLIVALGTLIIAIVGVLQIIKVYEFLVPTWFFFILGIIIVFCLMVIIDTLFSKSP